MRELSQVNFKKNKVKVNRGKLKNKYIKKKKEEGEVGIFLLSPASAAQSSPVWVSQGSVPERTSSSGQIPQQDPSVDSRGADLHPQWPRRLSHNQVGDKGASTLPRLLGPISA